MSRDARNRLERPERMTIRCGGLPLLNPPKIGWEIRIGSACSRQSDYLDELTEGACVNAFAAALSHDQTQSGSRAPNGGAAAPLTWSTGFPYFPYP